MYNMSSAELKILDIYLFKVLKRSWIYKSKSLATAPILFAPKKNGELQLCINYYELNTIIIKNWYSLPLISELLNRINGFVIFLKINLKNAYHQIRIHKDDEWKTTFRMQYSYYEFLIVLFNLMNTPAIFQSYINQALWELVDDFCIIYLNNILVFSWTKKEHMEHLQLIIKHLQCIELYANSKKCEFFKFKIKFLGFLVNKQDI